jgi:hypothetical protein
MNYGYTTKDIPRNDEIPFRKKLISLVYILQYHPIYFNGIVGKTRTFTPVLYNSNLSIFIDVHWQT